MLGKRIIVKIDGMSCSHCAKKVEENIKKITNVKLVKVNLDKKNAVITYKSDIDINSIKDTIEELNYVFKGVED